MSNERELFEQWAKLNGYDLTPSKTYETGYESDATTYAKAGFQAGRASMQDDVRKDAWISVEDRLPDCDIAVDVIVSSTARDDYKVRQTDISFINGVFKFKKHSPIEYVSHWQPLPSPPLDKARE